MKLNLTILQKTSNEMIKFCEIKNNGHILLFTLVILTALSIICVLGLKTAYYDLQLSSNDRYINKLKISADSAAAIAIEMLEKQPDNVLADSNWESPVRPSWFSRGEGNQFDTESSSGKYKSINAYIKNPATWKSSFIGPYNCSSIEPETDSRYAGKFENDFKGCRFQVMDVEIAPGSSLEIGNSYKKLHNLFITGLSEERNGKSMVQIGYRKRY